MSRAFTPLNLEPTPLAGPLRAASLVRSRFRALVQSPLRADLLRHFHAHPRVGFDLDSLAQTFGRLRVDVENCLAQLAEFELVEPLPGAPGRYVARIPSDPALTSVLEEFMTAARSMPVEDMTPAEARFRDMIGPDEKMLMIFESIRTVAKTDLPVLILGPAGSGTEVVARLVHELSKRRRERFHVVNCAALPDSMFEPELFGFERGGSPNGHDRKPGRLELANRGTLFLDEVGDVPLPCQARLLRAIEERRLESLGLAEPVDLDLRLVCGSHRALDAAVMEGRFREDLYYRVNACQIRLPSLRERPADIPVLADRFLAAYCASQGLAPEAKRFSPGAMSQLLAYAWPGNVRELEATVSRAAVASSTETIEVEHVNFLHPAPAVAVQTAAGANGPLRPLRAVERDHIQRVLDATNWNKKRAARVLEIGRETLYRKIDEFQLTPSVPLQPRRGATTSSNHGTAAEWSR